MIVDIEELSYEDVEANPKLKKRLLQLTNNPRSMLGSIMRPLILGKYQNTHTLRIFVARHRGKIVGWLTAHHDNQGDWLSVSRQYSLNVYIDPKYRRRGVASLLIQDAKESLAPLKRRFAACVTRDYVETMWSKHRVCV